MRTYTSLLATFTIATLGLSSITVSAVPENPPDTAKVSNNGGIFMSYFQNLANNDCTGSQIVQ